MGNKIIFVRHAKTKVDKQVPIEQWILAEDGQKASEELAKNRLFDNVDILISSSEKKSYLTIKPLADRLHKKITQISELGEIKRPNSEKMTLEEYDDMKVRIFKDLDYTNHGWETANHALQRFREAVEKVDQQHKDKTILICAHGTVMTLYFAHLQHKLNDLFSRWDKLEFGSYGIVENGKVIRDVV